MCGIHAQQNVIKYLISYLIYFISDIYCGWEINHSIHTGKRVSAVHVTMKTLNLENCSYLHIVSGIHTRDHI